MTPQTRVAADHLVRILRLAGPFGRTGDLRGMPGLELACVGKDTKFPEPTLC